MTNLIEWGVGLILDWISNYGYLGIIFLMALESATLPVPSEIVMPFAGFLVYSEGHMSLIGVILAGSVGCSLGSIAAYAVGYHAGRPLILRYGKYILLREKHLVSAEKWFAKYGDKATFVARLLPVVRTVISLPAGIAKMNFKKFVLYSFLGSVPWTAWLAVVGSEWEQVSGWFRGLDIVVVVAGISLIVLWYLRRSGRLGRKQPEAQP